MLTDQLHWLLIPILLFAGALVSCLACFFKRIPSILPVLFLCSSWAVLFLHTAHYKIGGDNLYSLQWYPKLNINLSFALTPLGLWMSHIVIGVGSCVAVYAFGYFHNRGKTLRFLSMMLAFSTAMVGLVLSDNLILLFIFWESTSILSFLMVGFYYENESARESARRALLITMSGGLFLLAGLILLGYSAETFQISQLPRDGSLLDHRLYIPMTILIFIGAFTKSAQVPFHFWLPGAMSAPTPASCYLHSATMVKVGIFLLALLSPVLGSHYFWKTTLITIGVITLVYGSYKSLFKVDLKAILANTTIAVLGLLTMLIGIGTSASMKAMVLFLTGHALYKATLFMSAGIIDHHSGTRHLTRLKGLRRSLPLTSIAALLAAFSMSGIPGTFGFLAKEYTYKSLLSFEGPFSYLLLGCSILASAMMILAAFQVGLRPYSGIHNKVEDVDNTEMESTSESMLMTLPPLFLALTGIILGVFPSIASSLLLEAAESLGTIANQKIKIWHGFNTALYLSGFTLFTGFVLWKLRHYFSLNDHPSEGISTFDKTILKILNTSKNVSAKLQFGTLRSNIIIITIVTVALVCWKFLLYGVFPDWVDMTTIAPLQVTLCFVTAFAAILAASSRNMKRAILHLGVCGFGSSMLFLSYGAPDLAITQVTVDILLCVLLASALSHLPASFIEVSKKSSRLNALVSIVFATAITTIVLKSLNLNLAPSVSEQILQWSKPLAHGSNVVNVILVDFRALDTLGEITVLCIAAIGIGALSKKMTKDEEV